MDLSVLIYRIRRHDTLDTGDAIYFCFFRNIFVRLCSQSRLCLSELHIGPSISQFSDPWVDFCAAARFCPSRASWPSKSQLRRERILRGCQSSFKMAWVSGTYARTTASGSNSGGIFFNCRRRWLIVCAALTSSDRLS